MKNFVTKPVLYVALGLSVISCKSYQHSHRLVEVDRKHSMDAELNVDVEIIPDFTKRIKGQSNKTHKTAGDAKDEAYFNAIVDNQIDVLIAPIYSVEVSSAGCEAVVHGYAGTYKVKSKVEKQRPPVSNESDQGAKSKEPCEFRDCFEEKLEDLTKLSKIDGILSSQEEKVYKINQTCGDCKNNEPLSLLTVTNNKASLVDTYEKVLKVGTSNIGMPSMKVKLPKFSKK
jgi:hypothetical protein